jgi:hypothetical protein
MSAADAFASLLDHARRDPQIVGLLLAGSRGKQALVTPTSDYDAYIILRDPSSLDAYAERFPSSHGDPVEYIFVSLDSFRIYALPGTASRWNAYTFSGIKPLIDELDGEIERLAIEKTLPGPDDEREFLDGYINMYYRSKKNLSGGRTLEGQLDAAESITWFLDFLFAAHGRVRPFNKWLLWELENHPLSEPWTSSLSSRITAIVSTGSLDQQRHLYRDAEDFARQRGLSNVIDSWGPDVQFLRD